MQQKLRVLIVEDSDEDAFFLVRELKLGGFEVESERVDSLGAMQRALKAKHWDLILSDYSMPEFSGVLALVVYKESGLDIPFFLVSGLVGEHIAVDMLKAGAHYYLKKDQLVRLAPAVQRELKAAAERRIRRQTEATASYLASLVESCDEAIVGLTLEGKVVSWNAGAERLYGHGPLEMIGCSISLVLPPYRPRDLFEMLEKIQGDFRVEDFETVHLRRGLSPVEVLVKLSAVRNAEGRVIGASAIVKDITHRKAEEAERLALIQELSATLGRVNMLTEAGRVEVGPGGTASRS